jgi:hypothetical protein
MQHEKPSTRADRTADDDTPAASPEQAQQRREAPRYPLPVRAVVEIPGLPARDYGVCEISRSGMFLAFLDARMTRPEFEQSEAGPGTGLKITFEVTHPDVHFRCDIPARVVRATHAGIGVQVDDASHADMETVISMLPPMRTGTGGDPA